MSYGDGRRARVRPVSRGARCRRPGRARQTIRPRVAAVGVAAGNGSAAEQRRDRRDGDERGECRDPRRRAAPNATRPAVASCEASPHSAANNTPNEVRLARRNVRGLPSCVIVRSLTGSETSRSSMAAPRPSSAPAIRAPAIGQECQYAESDGDECLSDERGHCADENRVMPKTRGEHQCRDKCLIGEFDGRHQRERRHKSQKSG